MAIEFGIFDHVESRGGASAVDIYENRIALLRRAEEGGFYAFHLAEHHGHALSISPSATTFLAALARETTRLKLIPTVVCLPLHNPVRIFEELAMLDVLSHGRLELGVGRGITPFEHLQFGSPPAEASARSKDIMALLLRAWETGTISSEGSDFYEFLEMRLPFKPVQHPYPPLWTAGNFEAAWPRRAQSSGLSSRHARGPRTLRRAARREPSGAGTPEPARHRTPDRPMPGRRYRGDG